MSHDMTEAVIGMPLKMAMGDPMSQMQFHGRAQSLLKDYNALYLLIHKVHTAKGRYHTQLAMCDLFDAVGLSNERQTTKTRPATREEKISKPGVYEVKE